QWRRLDAGHQALEVWIAASRAIEGKLLVARVDEQDAAGPQVAVEGRRGARREVGLARGDRPVDQRIKPRLVALEVDRRRIARFDRGAVAQDLAQALEA